MVFCDDAVAVSPSFSSLWMQRENLDYYYTSTTTISLCCIHNVVAVCCGRRTDGRTYKDRGLLTTGPMCVCVLDRVQTLTPSLYIPRDTRIDNH